MGHHIDDEGRFQSDKHPELPPNRIRLSLEAPLSIRALMTLADDYEAKDPGFSEDVRLVLRTVHGDDVVERALRPAIVITVSGGKLDADSLERVQKFIASQDAHRIQVIEQHEDAVYGVPFQQALKERDLKLAGQAELLEAAWGIIANAQGGDWDAATPDWKAAATRWRDDYHGGPPGVGHTQTPNPDPGQEEPDAG